jgi:hypothetical protein
MRENLNQLSDNELLMKHSAVCSYSSYSFEWACERKIEKDVEGGLFWRESQELPGTTQEHSETPY